jgi:transcriptional/translational regulatory protein YebC/TACO1
MPAIDAGAQDIVRDDDVLEVICEPADVPAVREALEQAGVAIESADVAQRPRSRVPVDEDAAPKLMRLIDALEELDDVAAVNANFDIEARILERIAS